MPWPGILLLVLAPLCVAGALHFARKRRVVEDTPTCPAAGVFIGLVELKGTAESGAPLASFLAGAACVAYRWNVEEHWSRTVSETVTDAKGNTRTVTRQESGWKTVASGEELAPFWLRDATGDVLVRPAGAELEMARGFQEECRPDDPLYYGKCPAAEVGNTDHRRRFTEETIPLGAPVFVIGKAREREDAVAPEVAQAEDAPIFEISVRTEEQVVSSLRWSGRGLGIAGVAAAAAGAWVLSRAGASPAWIAVAGGGALGIWVLGGAVMVFNSLVNLRQRARQAWANVDVQLKRRADLIPNLVAAVEGYRGHEAGTLETVTALRNQLRATPPGQPGPDPAGCATLLAGVVERYPDLKANASFLALQKELSDTETRVAMAREYFNTMAAFYNTRVETIPDGLLGRLAGMKRIPLFEGEGFGKKG